MGRHRNPKTSRAARAPAPTSAYYLRSIPADLWDSVMAKAKAEGRNVRWVILQALQDWLDGLYKPDQKEANTDAPSAGIARADASKGLSALTRK